MGFLPLARGHDVIVPRLTGSAGCAGVRREQGSRGLDLNWAWRRYAARQICEGEGCVFWAGPEDSLASGRVGVGMGVVYRLFFLVYRVYGVIMG